MSQKERSVRLRLDTPNAEFERMRIVIDESTCTGCGQMCQCHVLRGAIEVIDGVGEVGKRSSLRWARRMHRRMPGRRHHTGCAKREKDLPYLEYTVRKAGGSRDRKCWAWRACI